MSNIILKEITALEKMCSMRDEEGVFCTVKKVPKYSVALVFRRSYCSKRLKLNPVHNVR